MGNTLFEHILSIYHPMKLSWKKIIMLLQNLNISGQCNRTRLFTNELWSNNIIEVNIRTAGNSGKNLHIPRILH